MPRREFEEKRSALRMVMDCQARCRLESGSEPLAVRVLDLSSQGLGLMADRELEPGCRFEIRIAPARQLVPPLHARAEVVRAEPAEGAGVYRIGARILEML